MSRFKAAEGDWVCSKEDCENVNFAKRDKCNKCGRAKGASYIVKKAGTEIGSKFAEKSKGLFSADDWQCSKCGNINWARRTTCNVCNAPKVGPDEHRTGYGGGFKENANIVYDRKDDDSDGEFDEFGRKKKKYRGQLASVDNKEDSNEKQPDEEKVSPEKYNDEEDEEEEEEEEEDDDDDDDDDDVDLSKYNLDSDDDDDAPPPEPKILKRSSESEKPDQRRDRSRSPISRK